MYIGWMMKKILQDKEDKLNEWNGLKCILHSIEKVPHITEGEIWWCCCGENVGVEINGKNNTFTRPVLVFRKFSEKSFYGIPLTSQFHSGSWYVEFSFHKKMSYAVLSQARVFDARRLHKRMGEIAEWDMQKVIEGFERLFIRE